MSPSALLSDLSRDFKKSEVKQRAGRGNLKLDYISIDSVINRLNEVLGMDWSLHTNKVELTDAQDGKYLATVSVSISVETASSTYTSRAGVGAHIGPDPDDTIKTALAEAIKKAANQFGVGLYLWDEEKRDEIGAYRKMSDKPNVGTLQRMLVEKFLKANPTRESADKRELAKFFGINEEDLKDAEKLLELVD